MSLDWGAYGLAQPGYYYYVGIAFPITANIVNINSAQNKADARA